MPPPPSPTPAARWPWAVTFAVLAAAVIQLLPDARALLIFDRGGLDRHEWWRLWTGHLVHFGWMHFVVDTGLLIILGWLGERHYPAFTRWGMLVMPLFISASIYWFEPDMIRYGGLSALNLGLLLYVAVRGWGRDWTDWFWPAVIVIYIGELFYEYFRGGHGGGAIRFDDDSIRVATGAHLASAVYALLALAFTKIIRGRIRPAAAA